ncbi:hypothetical protein AWU65_11270 [Paenibacillus glucanolyticus]|uniref:Zinc ribbon domain-containing protein n=1 Tax=Paenibacillus glucanolyticus TaxID=59843 RepID=A0A163J9Q1_9BACL|nr:hypothetical protein [Paenibacillus glucanolyticus]KZS46453.1 hypothetical protein AWU65_11270 [Paenibacillus glucanolyticus]
MQLTQDPSTALQQARTEDLTSEEIIEYGCVSNNEQSILKLLCGPGCHLLEGSRGVGKSMLLRLAELSLDESFPVEKVVGVYVNFKTSILLENDRFSSEYYSFKIWVMAKILQEFTNKLLELGLIEGESTLDPYNRLLNVNDINTYGKSLDQKIIKLQKLALTKDNEERRIIESEIGTDFAGTFNNVELITETIREVCNKIKLKRIVFLFDEAAHTFIPEQQKIFFEMVKLLHGDVVSIKVAVYPGVTSYGGNFEYGQDAIPIPLERYDMYTATSREGLKSFFRQLLQKRLGKSPLAKTFFSKGEVLDLAIYLSNGNPRAFLHIMSKLERDKEFSTRNAILATAEYVENELVIYHKELSKRLPKLSNIVDLGYDVLRHYVVGEIQRKNEGKAPNFRKQTVFFTLEKECHFRIHRAMQLLCYSGLITKMGLVKIRDRKTAQRYAINLGIIATDKAFAKPFARQPADAIKLISKDDYREFYSTDQTFEELVQVHNDSLPPCTNCGRERENPQHAGCPYCMVPYSKDSILPSLLDDDIDKLAIPQIVLRSVKVDGRYKKVKDILFTTLEQLQSVYLIGPVRSRILRNAAEEYISG